MPCRGRLNRLRERPGAAQPDDHDQEHELDGDARQQENPVQEQAGCADEAGDQKRDGHVKQHQADQERHNVQSPQRRLALRPGDLSFRDQFFGG